MLRNLNSKFCVILALTIGLSASGGATDLKIYRFNRIVDGTGETLSATDIVVEGRYIVEVGNALDKSFDGELVLFEGLTALPGLIDAHTHITYGLPAEPKGDAWAELGQTIRDERYQASIRNAMLSLRAGVTTVRDLNADQNLDFELRDAINSGEVVGPRIFTSGPGIHPFNDPLPEDVEEASADFLKAAAERRLAAGADWIKVFGTTGSAADLTSTAYYSAEAIAAAAEAAKKAGKRITVHSYGPEAVDAGIAAGVTSLDHPVGISDEQIIAMRTKGIIYVPTIDHNRYYAQHAQEYGYNELIKQGLHAFVQRNIETVRRAHSAGVTIAMGSDAVLTGFGENTCELKAFIAAGMSTSEAIQTATVNGAKLLGTEHTIGRVQAGFIADIIAVDGNPLNSIDALVSGVTVVFKEGKILVDNRDDKHQVNRPNCGPLY